MKKIIIATSLLLTSYSLFAQKGATKVTDNTQVGNGIFYYLPLTKLTIDVTIEKNEYQPGYLNEFAEQYLGEKPATKANTSYAIGEIKIKTRISADPNELYFVSTAGNGFDIVFNPDQTIRSINIQPENANHHTLKNANGKNATNNENPYRYIKTSEKIDTIYTRQVIDSVLIEKRTIQKVYKKASKEETAKEVAQKLAEIQNFKYNLLSYNEDDSYNAETIQLKLTELNKLEEAYLELFNGKTISSKQTQQYTWVPTSVGEFTLFLFDDSKGITENISNSEAVKIKIEVPTSIKTFDKNSTGLAYRQAANATIHVLIEGKTITTAQLPILQLGQIKRFPTDDLSKIKIEFDAQNGSIKQMGIIGK